MSLCPEQTDRSNIDVVNSAVFPQDVSKRMSLPMDIRLPPEFLQKLQLESENSPLCKPLSRTSRRASLVSALHYCTLSLYLSIHDISPWTVEPWQRSRTTVIYALLITLYISICEIPLQPVNVSVQSIFLLCEFSYLVKGPLFSLIFPVHHSKALYLN